MEGQRALLIKAMFSDLDRIKTESLESAIFKIGSSAGTKDLIFQNGKEKAGNGLPLITKSKGVDRLMNLCIDTMHSFLGKFKLDQGMLCCRMIYKLKSTRIL